LRATPRTLTIKVEDAVRAEWDDNLGSGPHVTSDMSWMSMHIGHNDAVDASQNGAVASMEGSTRNARRSLLVRLGADADLARQLDRLACGSAVERAEKQSRSISDAEELLREVEACAAVISRGSALPYCSAHPPN
jgi:hypothetical protein